MPPLTEYIEITPPYLKRLLRSSEAVSFYAGLAVGASLMFVLWSLVERLDVRLVAWVVSLL